LFRRIVIAGSFHSNAIQSQNHSALSQAVIFVIFANSRLVRLFEGFCQRRSNFPPKVLALGFLALQRHFEISPNSLPLACGARFLAFTGSLREISHCFVTGLISVVPQNVELGDFDDRFLKLARRGFFGGVAIRHLTQVNPQLSLAIFCHSRDSPILLIVRAFSPNLRTISQASPL
jgi:hypothetical protein